MKSLAGMIFLKMHGAGNDFVVLDARLHPLANVAACAHHISNRHTGIGCDQIIIIEPDPAGADAFMRILNADGSEAGACGNATRCVARLLAEETGRTQINIRTISGLLACDILPGGIVEVDMGAPSLAWNEIPLSAPADTLNLDLSAGGIAHPAACSMGNPHATFFVDNVESLNIAALGPQLEHAAMFPARANIGFAQVVEPNRIRLRVWERGAGLTLACGSGACAALVNAHRRGLAHRQALLVLDGGELEISWRESDGHVLMRGPAEISFTGQLPDLT